MNNGRLIKGFSLVETSIVLLILGVFIGILASFLPQTNEVKLEAENIKKMNQIEEAIKAFVQFNRRLPCPADITLAPNTANFAVEASNCNTTIAGDITLGTVFLRIGMIPVRTLGLPDEYAFDVWGNRIRFGMVRELAYNTGTTNFNNFDDNFTAMSPNVRTFEIRDNAGNAINPANSFSAPVLNNSVAYVLLSHGENGNGAVPYIGGASPACPASGLLDQENCNADRIFRDTIFSKETSNYFDDYIRWKTYNQLLVDSGLLGNANQLTDNSDVAILTFFNTNATPDQNTGVGTASGGWRPRSYNTVVRNFTLNPLVATDPAEGVFTLTPGVYQIYAHGYYTTGSSLIDIAYRIRNAAGVPEAVQCNGVITRLQSNYDSVLGTSCSFTITKNNPIRVEIMPGTNEATTRYANNRSVGGITNYNYFIINIIRLR